MVTLFLISGIYSFYTISVLTLVIVCDWGWCLLSGIPIPHFRSRAQLPELICSCWLLIVHASNDPPNPELDSGPLNKRAVQLNIQHTQVYDYWSVQRNLPMLTGALLLSWVTVELLSVCFGSQLLCSSLYKYTMYIKYMIKYVIFTK